MCCLAFACLVSWSDSSLFAQERYQNFSATNVFREVNQGGVTSPGVIDATPWWSQHVQNSMREVQPMPADLHTILYLAIHNSNQIRIAKTDPLIRETAIQEADSAFDWVRYLDAAWNDISEPVGNALTVGGNANRFNDQQYSGTAGVRRTTRSGGQLDISQRFGWQDNNSQFFLPDDQATGRLTLSYSHPLLRGRGAAYNNAIVFLAQLDSEVAKDEFLATLQDELLEITRVYWGLYRDRAVLAHQLRLYLRTREIYQTLSARQTVDAQGTQAVLAASALESRRADLIRAQTAVTNAETRLRGMINAQELGNSDELELIPVEALPAYGYQADLQNEIHVALSNRPEIRAAVQQVKAGSVRLGVAENELLPALNLVTQGYLTGLNGDSDFGQSFVDQFSTGRPSYSVGVQYELPVGNRLAKARLCRRKHELNRLQTEYARSLEIVKTEVDIAVREIQTSHREIEAKRRALAAAEAEVNTIEKRWKLLIDGSGTSSLNLEALLRAQERVTAAEREYVTSQLTYSLAMVNLKRSNGTLLQSESVIVQPTCGPDGCQDILLDKAGPGMMAHGANGGSSCGCSSCGQQVNYMANANSIQGANVVQASGNQWQSNVVPMPTNQQVEIFDANQAVGSAAVTTPWGSPISSETSLDALEVAFGTPAPIRQATAQQPLPVVGSGVDQTESNYPASNPTMDAGRLQQADQSVFQRLPRF